MKYFFILGNHPALSLAELLAVLGKDGFITAGNEAAVFELDGGLDAEKLIKNLGGTIKVGIIGNELEQANSEKILSRLSGILPREKKEGKFKFGISVYGNLKLNEKKMGMEIKRLLKEKGISSRWVISKEKQLSSVVVDTNKLVTENGMEVVIMKMGGKIIVGKTLAVQPFRELSFRDYGRPSRDDLSGMLPPKLAQIMINLAGVGNEDGQNYKEGDKNKDGYEDGHKEKYGAVILDPFCGSGTILTEAMLMGFNNLIGSDISEKAIADTKENVLWMKEKFRLPEPELELYQKSATELSKFLKPESVSAIITEPYLGPQRGQVDLRKIKKELEDLYGQALLEFKKVLKKDGKIVMIWPVFHRGEEWVQLSPKIDGFKIVNPLKGAGNSNGGFKGLTNRGTLIYGREGQKVWREIVILEAE
ncbi:MAG: methyltransferase domain-containing protein [Patescibacteria group bacterium]|jgi:tRNA G10  N-methylase Trm11